MAQDQDIKRSRGRKATTKRRPLYQQTADELVKVFEAMEPGSYLPSEPALAKQIGVSRATLREAMRTFEERGMIVRQQGVGTYVTQSPKVIESGLEVLESVQTLAARINLEIKVGELEIHEREPSEEEALSFGIDIDSSIAEVSRTLLADSRPVTYLIDVVPSNLMPLDVLDDKFDRSVLDLLLECGTQDLSYSRTEITAVSASPDIARKLSIQRGDVLLLFEAWLCNTEGLIIDHSLSYFLPGIFRFHVVRRVGRNHLNQNS